MNILVLGYYDRHNLGDDMFKISMPKLFTSSNLTFLCIDDFKGDHEGYDGVICGGGDIVNDYFNRKYSKLLKGFTGPIFGVGIGIPYPGLISRGYMDMYDHVFIRERTDLMNVQRRLGSQYAHYLPDLAFALDFPSSFNRDKDRGKTVGVFLAQSIYNYKAVVFSFTQFLSKILDDYNVILFKFNTSKSDVEDDGYINKYIYESLHANYPNLKNDETVYSVDQMIDLMSNLDYGVCVRFHSHIFSTIAELPFLSVYSTRKVGLYITEEDYSEWACPIDLDASGKPLKFNNVEAYKKFKDMVSNSSEIVEKLKFIKNKFHFLLNTSQPEKLMQTLIKRPKILDPVEKVNVIKIYDGCSEILKKNCNYDPRVDTNNKDNINIDRKTATLVATKLCMDITKMPSSRYLYGTIGNVIQKPWDLKEMIKWIYKDFSNDHKKSCNRIYLDAYCQDTFRGVHRAGWQYVIDYMRSLHCFNGVICDMYIDLTFLWGKNPLIENGILPYTSPWIGFVHHCPDEIYTEYNNTKLIQDLDFQRSLITCKGIICLTSYLANWFKENISILGYDIPIHTLRHPTIIPEEKFSIENFKNNPNKKLINVGAWYRNPFTIYRINPVEEFTKCSLKGKEMNNYFCPETLTFNRDDVENNTSSNKWVFYMFDYILSNGILDKIDPKFIIDINKEPDESDDKTTKGLYMHLNDLRNSVETLSYLPNDEYDKIFSENVIFLHLVDASAANTLIECIVRNTPVLVNKIDPVVEYLGEEYPLYYEDLNDIRTILTVENVYKTSEYLQKLDKTFLTIENFIETFRDDTIYSSLISN